ncbi:uncharacterized protein LOC125444446 [Sphaerodactylus townsendi]|uniref:uncharacterized protein LOC125444446 n=1 Tax=Sphaerodactylus townsendi TaxID=933632 RepID=UPI002026F90C|nr:uncharacterized protein LOC125444446 [Sphaerodactylus townsendi]
MKPSHGGGGGYARGLPGARRKPARLLTGDRARRRVCFARLEAARPGISNYKKGRDAGGVEGEAEPTRPSGLTPNRALGFLSFALLLGRKRAPLPSQRPSWEWVQPTPPQQQPTRLPQDLGLGLGCEAQVAKLKGPPVRAGSRGGRRGKGALLEGKACWLGGTHTPLEKLREEGGFSGSCNPAQSSSGLSVGRFPGLLPHYFLEEVLVQVRAHQPPELQRMSP